MELNTDFRTAVQRKFWEMLYNQKKFTLSELANKVDKKASYLSRMAAEHEDLNIDFSLIRNLMKTTDSYGLLELLANDCGFILVKIPKVSAHKGDGLDLVAELNATVTAAVNAVSKYFQGKPTKATYDNAIDNLTNSMKKTVIAKKYIEKDYSGQLELNL